MQGRHKAREGCLQALYQMDVGGASFKESRNTVIESLNLSTDAEGYFDALLCGVTENREKIDALIEGYSKNWTIDRMTVVDRNILRIAAYEILYCPQIPYKVAIDEAVELAKTFASEDSGGFINGILDSLARDAAAKRPTPTH